MSQAKVINFMAVQVKRILGMSLLSILSNASAAGMNTNGFYEIEDVLVWADYTNGAFRLRLKEQDANANELCPSGYWLDGSNDKNSSVLSVVLSAYHAQSRIRVYAEKMMISQVWLQKSARSGLS